MKGDLRNQDEAWNAACEEAAKILYNELGRDATDAEITRRAEILFASEPDWDAIAKDDAIDFEYDDAPADDISWNGDE